MWQTGANTNAETNSYGGPSHGDSCARYPNSGTNGDPDAGPPHTYSDARPNADAQEAHRDSHPGTV